MQAVRVGEEWIVDAYGCEPAGLREAALLRGLLLRAAEELALKPLNDGFWHTFPGGGGVTGLVPLQESHLTVHTWPERGLAALNLYCCRGGYAWSWEERLRETLGAAEVSVRKVVRGVPGG